MIKNRKSIHVNSPQQHHHFTQIHQNQTSRILTHFHKSFKNTTT